MGKANVKERIYTKTTSFCEILLPSAFNSPLYLFEPLGNPPVLEGGFEKPVGGN